MNRGEVRWYKFARPDKKRPVLIITRGDVLDFLGEVTVAPITSRNREIPSQVHLTREDGLARDCVANCDHLQTITKAKIGPLITTLSAERMREVSLAIRFSLDLD